jgi:hypothetical protein
MEPINERNERMKRFATVVVLLAGIARCAYADDVMVTAGAFSTEPVSGTVWHPPTIGTNGTATTDCYRIGDSVTCQTTSTPGTPATPAWDEPVTRTRVVGTLMFGPYTYTVSCTPTIWRRCRLPVDGAAYRAVIDGLRVTLFYNDRGTVKETRYTVIGVQVR